MLKYTYAVGFRLSTTIAGGYAVTVTELLTII